MQYLPKAPGDYVDINVYNPDIEYFLKKFRNREYFAFVRYQDQWWTSTYCVLRPGQDYDPETIGDFFARHYNNTNYSITYDVAYENFLLLSQSRPNFYIGIKCMKEKFSKNIPLITQDREFLYAHCWRQMSTSGQIIKMFEEFSEENFIVVGPKYLSNLGKKLGLKHYHHVEISGTAASKHFNKTVAEVLDMYTKTHNENKRTFILSVGGFFGNALVNKLYDKIDDAFIIEMGRSLDVFYCHDKSFRDLPKFWWSLQWFGRKENMKAWTKWTKPFQSHE